MSYGSDNTFRAPVIRSPPIITPHMIESVQYGISHRAICNGCNSNVCVTTNQMIEKVVKHKAQCSNPERCRACSLWENTINPIMHRPAVEQLMQQIEYQAQERRRRAQYARQVQRQNVLRQRVELISRLPPETRKRLINLTTGRRRERLAAMLNQRRTPPLKKQKPQPKTQLKGQKMKTMRMISNTICIIRVILLLNDICGKSI